MNTASTIVGSTPSNVAAGAISIGALHSDGAPVPPAPVAPSSNSAHGRFRRANQHPGHQSGYQSNAPAGPVISEQAAKQMVVNGLGETLRHISQLPDEAERVRALQALLAGSSLTGFIRTNRGQRVDSVEALRFLINALTHMTTAKTFDGGRKHLFFFSVPRGWAAYAGDVRVDPLVRFYAKKDRKNAQLHADWKKAHEAAIAAGTPPPPAPPELRPNVTVETTGSVWGSWVNILRKSMEVDFIEMPVVTNSGVKREYRPVLINRAAPLHRARTLTFVISAENGQLLAWQPGRYIADMTPAQRMDRVILASGEVTEEEV